MEYCLLLYTYKTFLPFPFLRKISIFLFPFFWHFLPSFLLSQSLSSPFFPPTPPAPSLLCFPTSISLLRFIASILLCFLNGLPVCLTVCLLPLWRVFFALTVCLFAYITLFIILTPGSHYREGSPTSFQETINVKKVTYHSEYSDKTWQNDVALLQLERPITTSDEVNTVCLPESRQDQISPGTYCFITGKVLLFSIYCLAFCLDFKLHKLIAVKNSLHKKNIYCV